MEDVHPFLQLLKERRQAYDYSYRKLAKKVGVTHSYLSDIENGNYVFSVEVGLAICQVLEIEPYLCLQYIREFEFARFDRKLQKAYTEWANGLPGELISNLLQDQKSRQLHILLTTG